MNAEQAILCLVHNDDSIYVRTRSFSKAYNTPLTYKWQYIVNIKEDEFLMPVGVESGILNDYTMLCSNTDNVIIPYTVGVRPRVKISTASTGIFNAFVYCNNYNKEFRLAEIDITLSNGITSKYYIGQGIIIDNESNVLMALMDKIRFNKDTNKYSVVGTVLKLNPKVFTEASKPVNKVIIKDVLSILLNTTRTIKHCNTRVFTSNKYNVPISAEINSSINTLLSYPEPPKASFENKYIYDTLKEIQINANI